jgi:hypothetical protein
MECLSGQRRWPELTTPSKYTDRYLSKIKSPFWHQAQVSGLMERALRIGNPAYLRLGDLAMACCGYNGHAEMGHGELTRFLGVKDYRAVDDAIARAVEFGLLAEGSNKGCLRVPSLVLPYAGGGSQADKDRRRAEPCRTCNRTVVRPATCHPDRERRTKDGRCQPCYRRDRAVGKPA